MCTYIVNSRSKKFFAERIGTFVLVFLGTGAAVLGGGADSVVGYA
ncbi:hypothetical protein [Streptococcus macedonicus]